MAMVIAKSVRRAILESAKLVKLFTDDRVIWEEDMASDFDEPQFAGYAPQAFTSGQPCEFTCTEARTPDELVYGYFIVQADGGALVGAEIFTDGPYRMGRVGDKIAVTPELSVMQKR